MKIIAKSDYNEADQIIVELTSPDLDGYAPNRCFAEVILSCLGDGSTQGDCAEILILEDVLVKLPVSRFGLLAQVLAALHAATTPETEIPMLVDAEFDLL